MIRFLATRLAFAVPTLLAIAFLVFFAAYLAPGDPVEVMLGEKATPEVTRTVRHQLGLDRPPLVRYGEYVWKIVTQGDFGISYQNREPIRSIIARGFPNTAFLAASALLMSLLIGVPLGIVSAVYANRIFDRLAMSVALAGVAIPSFVLGPVLLLLFGLRLRLLPVQGFSLAEHPAYQYLFGVVGNRPGWQFVLLPTLVLAARSTALIARLTRSAMLDVLGQDYIRTARAKGLSPWAVLFQHALKNAFPPVLTVAGTTFGYLLSGSFVVERLFRIPGLGDQSITSILQRDYPVVQALALLLAAIFVLVNLIVDVLYGFFDPRARATGGGPLLMRRVATVLPTGAAAK